MTRPPADTVLKFVTHSSRVRAIARRHGWLPGARYTNLRDVRGIDRLGFLDINWKEYDFSRHIEAARTYRPLLTVARDVERRSQLARVLDQAYELARWADNVIIVPKVISLGPELEELIPRDFLLGFSVPTRYGGTRIAPKHFRRPVHLLGGRPDVQRQLANAMPVVSFDCNRFTLDAAFGDHFDGDTFRPHPQGGYETCLQSSLMNINALWSDYRCGATGELSSQEAA